jgi:hypothetical protein
VENDGKPANCDEKQSEEKPVSAAVREEHPAPKSDPDKCGRRSEKKHPLEWGIFILLFFTLIATGIAACYTRKQWITADDQERRSLRAYVGITNTPFDFRCGDCDGSAIDPTRPWDRNFIGIEIKNFGMTPAIGVHVRTSWTNTPFGNELPAEFQYIDTEVDPNLSPMSAFTLNPQALTNPSNSFGPGIVSDIKRARAHDIFLFFYGHIYFRDVFKKERITPFCVRYFPDSQDSGHRFGLCPNHNIPSEED